MPNPNKRKAPRKKLTHEDVVEAAKAGNAAFFRWLEKQKVEAETHPESRESNE